MKTFDPKKTIYLIDGSSFLYRAYYAMKPLHTLQGEPVQAVYGFVRMVKKLMNTFNPAYMAVVWDSPGKTSRHEVFEAYKATRQAPPTDLFEQKKRINAFCQLINLHELQVSGIEADDLLYSVAQDMKQQGFDVVLVTTDKDMGQTIDEHTFVYDAFKEILYDADAFQKKMGVPTEKLPFYFALLGDSSDNIPGVRGIGEKGALELVNQFDSLEAVYANLDQIKKPRMRTALETNKENAFLSYQLFLLRYHPCNITQKELAFDVDSWSKAQPLFHELNFKSLLKDMQSPADVPQSKKKPLEYRFKKVTTALDLAEMIAEIQAMGVCAVDTETTGIKPLTDPIVGISFATQVGSAWYVPFGHKVNEPQLDKEYVLDELKAVLEDANIKKYLHNAAFDRAVLWQAGILLRGVAFDSLLAARLTNQGWQKSGLKDLSEHFFGESMLSFDEVVKEQKYPDFSYVPLELATQYAATDAHQTFRLYEVLQERLTKEQQKELFEMIEHPLQQILLDMEESGIYLDKEQLAALGKKVHQELIEIEDTIITLAGPAYADINLNSPKQVEQLLFHDLKLAPQKKSAKGSYSTDQQVLQALAKEHPIPGLISKYRELAKLKNTYIDALPTFINPKSNKIHTSFSQTAVATGRLASFDPNLQNIPADAHGYGIEVRAAFKPDAGCCFVSADYSQIELRVMAYLSQDQNLLSAFARNADIHAETAGRLFGANPDEVTHAQRQIGKRINFSVLYGLTPYGLSKDLGIAFADAKQYIDTYFEQYPQVRAWMDQVIEETKQAGFVTTLYGRRRYVPGIYESNRALYQEAVRIAVNTKVQGTAADIMKIGMIKLDEAFKKQQLPARIVLQIHDELLISVPAAYEQQVKEISCSALEQVVSWNVPLAVTARAGSNWKEVTK